MTRIFPLAFVALGVVLTVTPAPAVTNPARVRHQNRRINRGLATGQLTPREAGRLRSQESHIAQERAAARADGHVTRHERRVIRHDLKRTSRHIWRQKHNLHRRYRRGRHHPLHHPRVYRHRHHVRHH